MRRGVRALALAVPGLALMTAGALATRAPTGGAAPRVVAHSPVNRGTVPTPATTGVPATTNRQAGSRGTVAAGTHLRIARLGVAARVTHVRVHHGVMDVPRDPHVVGWWRDGAAPGDPSGTAVLVGHVNYAGIDGAFARLPDLRPGDRIDLEEPGRRLHYRVAAVHVYPKSHGLPASAFARSGPPRLVLITCGGPFDAASGNYEDNVVVWAVPA